MSEYPNDLAKLLGELRTQCGMNDRAHQFATPEECRKLTGFAAPGKAVEIWWDGGEIVDRGVVFTLPGLEERDVFMGGVVQVPKPDNPGGKDAPPPEWHTLDSLLRNRRVTQIVVIKEQGSES